MNRGSLQCAECKRGRIMAIADETIERRRIPMWLYFCQRWWKV